MISDAPNGHLPQASSLPMPSSHGVLSCPLTGVGVVLLPVSLVEAGDFRHEGIVRVGIGEQRAD